MQKKDQIISIPLSKLKPFPNHPFSIKDDAEMERMTESVKENGVLTPIIARLNEDGEYEIISGHRRARACELSGITEVPVILKNCSREEAVIMMVDSNLQRENISPIEKGYAYKMKNDALYHSGKRFRQVGESVEHSITQIANASNDSERTIQRYIRLTELTPELQKIVEDEKMGLTTAVELSYLKPEEQLWVKNTIDSDEVIPSLSQAQKIKKLSKEGVLTEDSAFEILTQLKKPEQQNIVLTPAKISKYFPRNYTSNQVETIILKLLERWHEHCVSKQQTKSPAAKQNNKGKNNQSL